MLKRLKERPTEHLPSPQNRLGDWYANVLNIGRHRLAMATSERTLLTLVVPMKDSGRLRERFREAAHELLHTIGVDADLAAEEVRGMDRMPFGKTDSRSVLASMNDFAIQARAYFETEEEEVVYLEELQLFLGKAPCGPLRYRTPIEKTRELFGVPDIGPRGWRGPRLV